MSVFAAFIRRSLAVSAILSLAACGGGGGKGSDDAYSVSPLGITFVATQNGASPSPQQVSLTANSGTVYIRIDVAGMGIANVVPQFSPGSASGAITINPVSPTMSPGTYSGTVTVYGCADLYCTSSVAGSPKVINVTYTIQPRSGFSATPQSLSFSHLQASAAPAPQTLALSDISGGSYAWSASINYLSGSGWLTVNGASQVSGPSLPTSLSVGINSLSSIGTYSAVIHVTGNGNAIDIPVSYTVRVPQVTAALTSLAFSAFKSDVTTPATQSVTLSTEAGLPVNYSAVVVYGAGASGWLTAPASGTAPSTMTVGVNSTNLNAGTYTATLWLTTATQNLSIGVTYQVQNHSLTITPGQLTYAINDSSVSASLNQSVAVGDTGYPLSWTAVSSAPWLSVGTASGTTAGNGATNAVSLTLVNSELVKLGSGSYSGDVTFSFTRPDSSVATVQLAVTLNMNMSQVNFVAPYVAYVNEQQEVIIRGSGFSQPGLSPVMFGSQQTQSVNIISDTEIRAVPPSFASAGRHTVSIANSLGWNRSRAELVVRNKPTYSYAAVSTNFGIQGTHLIYDAERDAVISARSYFSGYGVPPQGMSTVNRFSYNSVTGTWTLNSQFFPSLFDIAISPDGKELLVLCATNLYRVDPVTLVTNSTVNLPTTGLGTASQLAATNDGKVIIRDLSRTYSLLSNTFSPLSLPTSTVGIDISPDGSRAAMGEATNQGDIPLSYYDASTGTVRTTSAYQYYSPGSFNRSATKLLSGATVRDSNFSMIGGLPVLGDVMSQDGNRAYSYEYLTSTTGRIRVFDVGASGPGYPELTPITPPDYPGATRAVVSMDSRTLFLVGETKFIVQPLP